MTRNRLGWLIGIGGAMFASWWWRRRANARPTAYATSSRGETIYRNAPEPTGLGGGPT
jgi:hypothetical protein